MLNRFRKYALTLALILSPVLAYGVTQIRLPGLWLNPSTGVIDFQNAPSGSFAIGRLPIGSSGALVPLLNGAHTWSGSDDFSGDSSVKVPTVSAADRSNAAASTQQVANQISATAGIILGRASPRQTVSGGPATIVSGTSYPNWLAASATLVPTTQNISTSTPLSFTAAVGTNFSGLNDITVQFTSNPGMPTLTGAQAISGVTCTTTVCTVTTSAAHNLAVGATIVISGASQAAVNGIWIIATVPTTTTFTINGPNQQTGTAFTAGSPTGASYLLTQFIYGNPQAFTFSSSELVPIEQYGGTISTVNGQFTFDKQGMMGYLGNGTSAVATPLVAMAECDATQTAISACRAYTYNGMFESSWTTTMPAGLASYPYQTNLGTNEAQGQFEAEPVGAPFAGYFVGERMITFTFNSAGTFPYKIEPSLQRNVATLTFGNAAATPFYALAKSNGASTTIPSGSTAVRYKILVRRNWGGS